MNSERGEWRMLHLLSGTWIEKRCQSTSKRLVGMLHKDKSKKCKRRESKENEKCGNNVKAENVTIDGLRAAGAPGKQRVGTGVQRLECRPAYQPWGSTLTFQPRAGVSWVQGLRHGVTMHPRGRHLREGMTLLPTWESHTRNGNSSRHHNTNYLNNNYYQRDNRSCKGRLCKLESERSVDRKRISSQRNRTIEREPAWKAAECAKEPLCAGPSRPTSGKKRNVKSKRTRKAMIVCWAASPHQSEAMKRQQQQLRRKDTVRRQSEELYCTYKWE